MTDTLLVLDFGTTNFKAALFDQRGQMRALQRIAAPIQRDGGRSEMDPAGFRDAVCQLIRLLAAGAPQGLGGVRAVGFSTQANTFALLDAADQPLTPLIVWEDARALALQPLLDSWMADGDFAARTGIARLSHQFSVAKLRWLADQRPPWWSSVHRLCFLGDYFTHWLTGAHLTDGSIAAMSGLFDVQRWQWSGVMAQRAGIDPAWLPRVVRGGTIAGPLRTAAAQELGLPANCPVVIGCLDQHAGALGVGNATPGGFSETTGTVLATVRCSETFAVAAAEGGDRGAGDSRYILLRGPAAAPGRFYHLLAGDISANLLEFYRNQLPDRPAFEALDQLAAQDADDRLQLDGTLPPDALRARLAEWAASQPRGAVVRAIYRAVAEALAEQVHQLARHHRPDLIRSAGGAARSRTWLQIKADTLGIPMLAPACAEPALLGAAVLAAAALDWVPIDITAQDIPEQRLIHPRR